MRIKRLALGTAGGISIVAMAFQGGCSANDGSGSSLNGQGGSSNGASSSGGSAASSTGGSIIIGTGGNGAGQTGDPTTCAEAASSNSYVGCEFWPTVVANAVWSIFDFAIVVANTGDQPADITVEHSGSGVLATDQVPAFGLKKIYLPWVYELKGQEADNCGSSFPLTETKRALGGFRVTTTRPTTVYQFNALEYRGAGGPAGKSWAGCPGDTVCASSFSAVGCFSFSNDASLLLPSTAATGNYRVMGPSGAGSYFAVTGLQDNTNVEVILSPTASVAGGGGVAATPGGGTLNFNVNAGEVVQVAAAGANSDLSGSLVRSTDGKPLQVIAGIPCVTVPEGEPACDHIEESLFPAETLGAHYVVTSPTGALGNVVGHVVKIYGNQDGTTLNYPGVQPPGAPTTINAGQVVDLGRVGQDFEVVGDKEFGVGSFMLGGSLQDPTGGIQQKGDPSLSFPTSVEQFRSTYVFLAPDDYDVSYVDIIMPMSAVVTLDGSPINVAPIGISSGFGVARVTLSANTGGAHSLTSDQPVGIQVMGYGQYTSYQYPGGLNLTRIAPPPPK